MTCSTNIRKPNGLLNWLNRRYTAIYSWFWDQGVWGNLERRYSQDKYCTKALYDRIKGKTLLEIQSKEFLDSCDAESKDDSNPTLQQKLEILKNIGINHKDGGYGLTVATAVTTIFFTFVLAFIVGSPDKGTCYISSLAKNNQSINCNISSSTISGGASLGLFIATVSILVLLAFLFVMRAINENRSNKLLEAIYIMQDMANSETPAKQIDKLQKQIEKLQKQIEKYSNS